MDGHYSDMNETLPAEKALAQADRCVKCGLCLPHCPTYGLYADESESPRGRIALAEALLRGQLDPDAALQGHLERCLLCRACEANCPSGVGYAALIDAARARLPARRGEPLVPSVDGPWLGAATRAARLLHLPGLRGRLARVLPVSGSAPAPGVYPPDGRARGRIGLLLGCVTRTQQPEALRAAIRLLQRLGYEVVVPPDQGCCGALAVHQGDPDTARRQVEANRAAFRGLDGVVAIASGCSLQIAETLTELVPRDITAFLTEALQDRPLAFARPEGPIALHVPCTLANGLGATGALQELLGHLPGTEIHTLGHPGGCCGAAGTHLLTQREQAQRLRAPLMAQLEELKPRYLLTANVGCALHLAEGAMAQGWSIEVLHPVVLLARLVNEPRGAGGAGKY